MIPHKRILGYKTSAYTKGVWVASESSLWGGIVLAFFNPYWGWALVIFGVILAGIFLYCASVDHKRWCPIHGTEREETPEVQTDSGTEDEVRDL